MARIVIGGRRGGKLARAKAKAAFRQLVEHLGEQGRDDIAWAETLGPPANAEDFAAETIYVICNSGMKNTIARRIYARVMDKLEAGSSAHVVFGHVGKSAAINKIWYGREELFREFQAVTDDSSRLQWLGALPFIGKVTKYHLAKNFGCDVAKPDVHLQRMADRAGVTVQAMCEDLAAVTGYRVATVDTILWRACAVGLIDSKTGEVRSAPITTTQHSREKG